MPDRAAPRALIIAKNRERIRRAAAVAIGVLALVLGAALAGVVADGGGGATATAAAAPSGEDLIRAAQRRLGVPVDGVIGPATKSAIRSFQGGRGLPVTGRLDDPTLVALGVVREQFSVLSTTVASGVAGDPALAERASAPAEEPAATTAPAPTETATTPVATTTTPAETTPTTPEEPPVDEEAESAGPPVVGGALAGSPPPAVGGQVPDDVGLSPVPPRAETQERPEKDRRRDIPSSGGLSPTPPASQDTTIGPEMRARLARIARCESGGNPRAISANGLYRGKYQFLRSTWRSVGGKGDPARASEAEQDRRAAALYRREGASPWPVCGRR